MLHKLKIITLSVSAIIIFALLSLLLGSYSYISFYLIKPINVKEINFIDIEPGQKISQFTDLLAKKSIIDYPVIWYFYLKYFAKNFILKYGEYEIYPQMHLAELLDNIRTAKVAYYKFTLVEGWTLKQTLSALSKTKMIHELQGDDSTKLEKIQELLGLKNLEGWFFADTYYYHKYMRDTAILRTAHQKMQDVLSTAWENRQQNLPFDEPYQALILASIIEKESALPSERKIIAGVFINRLHQSMRLQSDPTVIYGLGDRYTGNLSYQDLHQASPYNTYTIPGLPPTPIASVGIDALLAAVQPEQTSALYFVSRKDGSHQFSETLEEHNAAVRRYQLQ